MNDTATKTAHTYFDRLAGGDLAGLGELFAPDVVWHQPGVEHLSGTYRGTAEVFAHLGRFMELSHGTFRIDAVHDIMVNGESVVATIEFSARRGDYTIAMPGVDLMRIENGQITEMWLFSANQRTEDAFWDAAAATQVS